MASLVDFSPAWTPAVIGAPFWDFSDFSTMFQNVTAQGVTSNPVTAVGQPVGAITDKSTNAKLVGQPTAVIRPTLARMPITGPIYRNLFSYSEDITQRDRKSVV